MSKDSIGREEPAGPLARAATLIAKRAGPAVDARNLGARPERAQRSFPNRDGGARTPNGVAQPVIDARSLGVRPMDVQRSFPNRSTRARTPMGVTQPVIDARSLGATPEEANKPFIIRKTPVRSPSGRQYPSEGSIFQSRNPPSGNGVQSHRASETDDFQQPFVRSKNGSQQRPHQEVLPIDKTGPTMRSEGHPRQSGRSRISRSRAIGDGDDSAPRRRKRGLEQRSDDRNVNGPQVEKWTAEELQYLEDKKQLKLQLKFRGYEPGQPSHGVFTGVTPTIVSDELGVSETLGERLLLARKYLGHKFIQWDSKEQKADVMAVVEKLEAVEGGDEQAESLMQKLIAGEYAKFKKLEQKDVLGDVERHVHRNDSFYPDDEKSLLDKVRSIMPAERAPKVGGRARNEATA